jgi:hypothetical protein
MAKCRITKKYQPSWNLLQGTQKMGLHISNLRFHESSQKMGKLYTPLRRRPKNLRKILTQWSLRIRQHNERHGHFRWSWILNLSPILLAHAKNERNSKLIRYHLYQMRSINLLKKNKEKIKRRGRLNPLGLPDKTA